MSAKFRRCITRTEFLRNCRRSYFRDEGFDSNYCHFGGLYALEQQGGSVVGMLGMDIPHLHPGHLVAVDELGVVDPADVCWRDP
jgi:hypothetical protein